MADMEFIERSRLIVVRVLAASVVVVFVAAGVGIVRFLLIIRQKWRTIAQKREIVSALIFIFCQYKYIY